MINLLKANLFRLRKSKTFKMSLFMLAAIIICFTFLYFSKEDYLMINTAFRDNRIYGFYIGGIKENISYMNFFRASLGFTIFLCIAMFFMVGTFTIQPYYNGMLKNEVAYVESRNKIYIANLISTLVGVFIISIFTMSLSMLSLSILFKVEKNITLEEIIKMAKITIVWLSTLFAMTSVYTLLARIVKSKALLATGGVLFITLISALLFDKVDIFLKHRIPIYMLLDICGDPLKVKELGLFFINSIIIIIISSILGCIIFSRQEIK